MATTFENINGHLICTKAKSKAEALTMRDDARKNSESGKSVVVFFNGRYHLYLAPGQDPYQIRKDIDSYLNPSSKKGSKEEEEKNTPVRDASGKFVSKKQTNPKPITETEEDLSVKKDFWDSLK